MVSRSLCPSLLVRQCIEMQLGLEGKRAAVAAASAGLGLASARALAQEGARVVICGRDRERIDAAAASITDTVGGGQVVPIVADVGDAVGGAAFVSAAAETLGGLDILVTNAGGPPAGNFASTPTDAYPGALELNLLSVVGMVSAAAPAMQEQRWGRIVAITSLSVRQPMANLILSNTARAGATGFLKTVARELAGSGVTVNSVQPGLHATDRVKQLYGDDPVGPLGSPDDFGSIVAFLCSEQAAFITGVQLNVDGGAYQALL
jgi:3-oxoacyl-[acyl-carrier protein] reductase